MFYHVFQEYLLVGVECQTILSLIGLLDSLSSRMVAVNAYHVQPSEMHSQTHVTRHKTPFEAEQVFWVLDGCGRCSSDAVQGS